MSAKDYFGTAGALASATLLAPCCLGLTLSLLFGTTLGALGALAWLQPYRTLFIGSGFGLWAYGFYRLYLRAPRGAENPGCGESCARPLRPARGLLWISLVVLLLSIASN